MQTKNSNGQKRTGCERKVAFVGAGKVGFSLGKYFAEGGIQVTGYYSRHQESAKQAAEFTGSDAYMDLKTLVNDSDVIFLTVPDGEIRSVFEQICSFDIRNKEICHCSGALSASQVFAGIQEKGAVGYSIHPLFPVSDKLTSFREMSGAFFCLEGQKEDLLTWETWLLEHSSGVRIIQGSDKVKYHAACAIASNLYCSLMQLSFELLSDCGFDEMQSKKALSPLVRSNVEHILEDGPVFALTGPAERGDVGTVRKHVECLENETDRMLYQTATEKLIQIARKKHPDRDYDQLESFVTAMD